MKEKNPISLKLSVELHQRLVAAAATVKLKKHNLALLAIEAAVEAVEVSGGALVVPLEFDLTTRDVPVSREFIPGVDLALDAQVRAARPLQKSVSSANIETSSAEIAAASLNEPPEVKSRPLPPTARPPGPVRYGTGATRRKKSSPKKS